MISRRCALPLAVLACTWLVACRENTYVAPPPPAVTVQLPVVQDVIDYLEYTGRTRAVESVQIEARVQGYLQSMHYTPGTDVKKGDLLFVIDPEPFEVDVAAKQAELSSRRAEAALAKTSFERSRQLYRQKATSEIEYLRFKAERDKADAAVAAAESALSDAQLNLDYAYVKSPIDGRAGRHRVDLGNLVGAGETTLLTDVVDYSPLFVYFQISEIDVLRVQRRIQAENARREAEGGQMRTNGAAGAGSTDATAAELARSDAPMTDGMEPEGKAPPSRPVDAEPPDDESLEPSEHGYEASGGTRYGRSPSPGVPPVEVGLADEEGYPHKGFLDFADSQIDSATGTLELRGVLENEGEFEDIIMPGSFTRVRIPVGRFEDAMLVPDRALGTDQGGRFVFVVGDGDLVEQRYVEVGGTYEDMRRIVSGLAPTERVVVNGIQRARPGAAVAPELVEGRRLPEPPPTVLPEDAREPEPMPPAEVEPGPPPSDADTPTPAGETSPSDAAPSASDAAPATTASGA